MTILVSIDAIFILQFESMTRLEFWILDDIRSDMNAFRLAAKDLPGYKIRFRSFTKPGTFLSALKQSPPPDVAILDIQLKSKLDGLDLCDATKKTHPSITVCIFSRYLDAEHMRLAGLMGASAFISKQKPIEIQLREFLKSYLAQTPKGLEKSSFSALEKAGIPVLGQSTKKVLQSLLQVIREDLTLGILLTGSEGTGKTHTLQALNSLLGSSFKKVTIQAPLFQKTLDEIPKMGDYWLFLEDLETFSVQEQESLYRKISSLKTQKRPRILATTRLALEDLRAGAKTSHISNKLLTYLSAEHIQIPDLAARREEIHLFLNFFLKHLKNGPFLLTPEVSTRISSSAFTSGNIRELKEAVERMGSTARSGKITIDCLPPHLLSSGALNSRAVSIHLAVDSLDYQTLSGHLLLELVRIAANQDRNAGRKTTIRSLERNLRISRNTITERLHSLEKAGTVTLDELRAIFGEKYGRNNS